MQLIGGITMTKAQEVRQRRLDSIQADRDEVIKIFEWILDLLDKRTERKEYTPIEVSNVGFDFLVSDGFRHQVSCNRLDCTKNIFDTIKDMFNNEEGYSAELFEDNCRMFRLRIVIE